MNGTTYLNWLGQACMESIYQYQCYLVTLMWCKEGSVIKGNCIICKLLYYLKAGLIHLISMYHQTVKLWRISKNLCTVDVLALSWCLPVLFWPIGIFILFSSSRNPLPNMKLAYDIVMIWNLRKISRFEMLVNHKYEWNYLS